MEPRGSANGDLDAKVAAWDRVMFIRLVRRFQQPLARYLRGLGVGGDYIQVSALK